MKQDKKAVAFEHPAKGAHHCSECRHYRADETCEIVAGRVLPRDWCKEFKAKSTRARRLKALLLEMR